MAPACVQEQAAPHQSAQTIEAFHDRPFGYSALMPRKKTIPDSDVYAAIRQLLAAGGDKAVAFGSVARQTGLAAATLVQRYGSREGMVQAALSEGWDRLDAACQKAEAEAPVSAKGAATFLKAIGADTADGADLSLLAVDFRDATLRDRAALWRARVEAALALRLGGGARAREEAAILFAAWMGQVMWLPAGGKGFKLKDALKRLT